MAINHELEKQIADLHLNHEDLDQTIEVDWKFNCGLRQNMTKESNIPLKGYYRATSADYCTNSVYQPDEYKTKTPRGNNVLFYQGKSSSLPEELNKQGVEGEETKRNVMVPSCSQEEMNRQGEKQHNIKDYNSLRQDILKENQKVKQDIIQENIKAEEGDKKNNQMMTPCSPIKTLRLRPFRQMTKKAVATIQEDGSVCMEFFRNTGTQEKISQVMHISSDGMKVKFILHIKKARICIKTITFCQAFISK